MPVTSRTNMSRSEDQDLAYLPADTSQVQVHAGGHGPGPFVFETFGQKLFRKIKENPFVPLGR